MRDRNVRRSLAEHLESRQLFAATAIAMGLDGPENLEVSGGYIYFIDNTSTQAVISRVPTSGGTVTSVLQEPLVYAPDLGRSVGYDEFATDGTNLSAGRGDYVAYTIDSVGIAGGTPSSFDTAGGGKFVGIANGQVYFGSTFDTIDSEPIAGGSATPLASGYWMRSTAMDSNSIYFVDYDTKNVDRFDFATQTVTPLITGNSAEGSIFIDSANVFFNINGTIEMVPKTGGQVTTLVTSGTATGYAADGTNVYYVDNNTIFAMPEIGRAPTSIANVPANSLNSIAVDETSVYWTDVSGGTGNADIFAVPKPAVISAGAPSTPTLITPTAGAVVGFGPTFTFSAIDPNKKRLTYQLELQAGSSDFIYSTTTPMASGVTAAFHVPIQSGIPYGVGTWRVRAKDSLGLFGPWSAFNSISFGGGIDRLQALTSTNLQSIKNAGAGYFITTAFGGKNPNTNAQSELDAAQSAPYNLATAAYCLLNFSSHAPLTGSQQMDSAISAVGDALPHLKFMAIDVETTSFNAPGYMVSHTQAIQLIQSAITELESVAAARGLAHIPVVIYTRS